MSSSGDLLGLGLFSAFRLRVDIFWMAGRRRRRMMLRLAFVECNSVIGVLLFSSRYAALKVVERLVADGLGSEGGEAWRARIVRSQGDAGKANQPE